MYNDNHTLTTNITGVTNSSPRVHNIYFISLDNILQYKDTHGFTLLQN